MSTTPPAFAPPPPPPSAPPHDMLIGGPGGPGGPSEPSSLVQNLMESIARGEEAKEELIFNPVTGELEVLAPAAAQRQVTKPVMTKIAKDGFFVRVFELQTKQF